MLSCLALKKTPPILLQSPMHMQKRSQSDVFDKDDLRIMGIDKKDSKSRKNSAELESLSESYVTAVHTMTMSDLTRVAASTMIPFPCSNNSSHQKATKINTKNKIQT